MVSSYIYIIVLSIIAIKLVSFYLGKKEFLYSQLLNLLKKRNVKVILYFIFLIRSLNIYYFWDMIRYKWFLNLQVYKYNLITYLNISPYNWTVINNLILLPFWFIKSLSSYLYWIILGSFINHSDNYSKILMFIRSFIMFIIWVYVLELEIKRILVIFYFLIPYLICAFIIELYRNEQEFIKVGVPKAVNLKTRIADYIIDFPVVLGRTIAKNLRLEGKSKTREASYFLKFFDQVLLKDPLVIDKIYNYYIPTLPNYMEVIDFKGRKDKTVKKWLSMYSLIISSDLEYTRVQNYHIYYRYVQYAYKSTKFYHLSPKEYLELVRIEPKYIDLFDHDLFSEDLKYLKEFKIKK